MEGRRHGKGSLYYNGKAEVAKWDDDIFVAIMWEHNGQLFLWKNVEKS